MNARLRRVTKPFTESNQAQQLGAAFRADDLLEHLAGALRRIAIEAEWWQRFLSPEADIPRFSLHPPLDFGSTETGHAQMEPLLLQQAPCL